MAAEQQSYHPIRVFCSYIGQDENLFRKLDAHLSALKRQEFISTWQNHLILPGAEKAQETGAQLNAASIILLLISAEFLASDYCYSVEMKRALERHSTHEARVIPIIVRPCDWSDTPIARLQCLPRDGNPITAWSDQDLAFKDIAIQLRRVVKELQEIQMNTPLLQEELVQNHKLQASQGSRVDEQTYRNMQLEHVLSLLPQVFPNFRRHQKKVSELKSIHGMLHEIEWQLDGLSATIKLIMQDERGEKEINQDSSAFRFIEIMWQQVVRRIDDLAYFATEVIETLEDERLSFDRNTIRGAPWIKDLLILQPDFERGIEGRDINTVKNLSDELIVKCRSHLYHIDKRLLEAVKELDLFPVTTQVP